MITLEKRVDVDKLLKAIAMLKVAAHPQRMAIIDLLARKQDVTVGDIQQELEIDQPIVSQHLTLMKDKGLLDVTRKGKHSYYFLKHPEFVKIIDCMENCCHEI